MEETRETELAALREMLAGCEMDLIRYRHHGWDPVLAANYNHKKAQADSLRERIRALERVGEKNA